MEIKYLIIPILIILLVFPKPTYAFLGTGIFDFFDTMLGGVEEAAGPMFAKMLQIFMAYVIGLVAMNVSASLLQLVTEHQDWLTVNNRMVSTGWHFSAGIVNMVLIVLAVFIALTIILKIETFEGKKAFIRLVMVALLLNFSLVFIGMLIDGSNFIYNAILTGNENLPFQIIDKFGGNAGSIFSNMIIWLVALAAAFAIPFIAPFAQLAFFLGVVSLVFLPQFLIWFFQIFCFFAISGLFFTYAFLFGARVFIIQLLAILSPFAALFLILPQTRKHWDEWLKHLFEWIFFGIALYLFLVIGLKATDALIPSLNLAMPTTGLGSIQQALTATFVYYFFLFIYLVVAIWISKKYMPTLAAAVIAQGAALGGFIWSKGIKPIAGTAGRESGQSLRKGLLKSERIQKGADTWAKSEGRFGGAIKRRIGRALGPGLREQEKGELAKKEAVAEKIKDPTLALSEFKGAMAQKDYTTALAYYNQAIKKGGDFAKEFKDIDIEDKITIGEHAKTLKAKPEQRRIARSIIKDVDEAQLERIGFKSYSQLDTEEKGEWDAKGYKTIKHSIIGDAKGDDIKEFQKGFWDDNRTLGSARIFWGGPQIRKAADEFGREFIDAFSKSERIALEGIKALEAVDPDGAEQNYMDYIHSNTKKNLFLATNAAQELGFESPYVLAPDQAKNKYKNIREVVAQKP